MCAPWRSHALGTAKSLRSAAKELWSAWPRPSVFPLLTPEQGAPCGAEPAPSLGLWQTCQEIGKPSGEDVTVWFFSVG